MEFLLTLDRLLFLRINHLPHSPLTDWIALFFSGAGSSGIIWLLIGGYLFFREERREHRFFLPMGIALGACFVLVEGLIKYVVARPRPDAGDGALIVGWAQWYSFPSSHAAISWAMAFIMSKFEPRGAYIWYALAGLISLSRIYLGVHFPLDVIIGGIIGWGIGSLSYRYFFQPGVIAEKRKSKKVRKSITS